MPTYSVQLNTDAGWAEIDITAKSIEDALTLARDCDHGILTFTPFEDGPVQEIIVRSESGEEYVWRSEELYTGFVAADLYVTAKNLLSALSMPWPSRIKQVRECISALQEAIDLADGRHS